MVSHRSGETEDTFIADLVVGLCTGQVKLNPSQSNHCVHFQQLPWSWNKNIFPSLVRSVVSVLPLRNSSTRMEISAISYSTLCRWRLWWHFPLLSLISVLHAHSVSYRGMLSFINMMHNSLPQVKVNCSFPDSNATACQIRRLVFLLLNSKGENWGLSHVFFSFMCHLNQIKTYTM